MALYNLQGKNALGQMVFWESTTIDFAGNDAPEPCTDIALIFAPDPNAVSGVASVFGRTGIVVAQFGDYDDNEVRNTSGVPGTSVQDALDYLLTNSNVPTWGQTLEVDNRSDGYHIVLTKNSEIRTENNFAGNSDLLTIRTGDSNLSAGSLNLIGGGAAQNGGFVQIRGGGSTINSGGVTITSEYGGQNTGHVKIGTGSYGTISTGSLTLNSGFNGKTTGDIHVLAGYEWSQPDTYSGNGTIKIKSADAVNTMATGGDGYFLAGNGNSAVIGRAGNLQIKAGSYLSGTGLGGNAYLYAGDGRGATKQGGNLEIKAGLGLSNALGGSLSIEAGSAQNANAGNLTIKSGGISGGTGRSGDILIQAGSSVGQPGGDILITGSNSISANSGNIYIRTPQNLTNAGGDIEIATGGGSVGGDLRLIAGREPLSTPGKITLQTGDLFIWPDADGTANQVLKTDGAGNLSWGNTTAAQGPSGSIQYTDGSGNFQGTDAFRYVSIAPNGFNGMIIKAGTPTVSGDPTANIKITNNTSNEVFDITYNQTDDATTIKSAGTSTLKINGGGGDLQWPKTPGDPGQILSIVNPGVMGWLDPDSLAGSTGITTLNTGEAPTAGTLGDDQPTGIVVETDPNPNGDGTNEGFITVFVNGIQYTPGDGVNTGCECYFRDGYGVIRNLDDVQVNDELYWNGTVAGFDLDVQDKITLVYSVFDKSAVSANAGIIATEMISSKVILFSQVSGAAFGSNTVEVADATGFAINDIIQITGARNGANNGYRAIQNIIGNVIYTKTAPNNSSVIKGFLIADPLVSGTVHKVRLSAIRNSQASALSLLEMTINRVNDDLWIWSPLGQNTLGEIKTSMLTETQFAQVTGFGWVLADGRSCAGSPYSALTGNTIVPDLRGQFLRGKNYTRSDSYANPNGDSDPGYQGVWKTRIPGSASISSDGNHTHSENSAGGHTHSVGMQLIYGTPASSGQTYYASGSGTPITTSTAGAHSHSINAAGTHSHSITGGDFETAPNHIIVNYFIYIGA